MPASPWHPGSTACGPACARSFRALRRTASDRIGVPRASHLRRAAIPNNMMEFISPSLGETRVELSEFPDHDPKLERAAACLPPPSVPRLTERLTGKVPEGRG